MNIWMWCVIQPISWLSRQLLRPTVLSPTNFQVYYVSLASIAGRQVVVFCRFLFCFVLFGGGGIVVVVVVVVPEWLKILWKKCLVTTECQRQEGPWMLVMSCLMLGDVAGRIVRALTNVRMCKCRCLHEQQMHLTPYHWFTTSCSLIL